MFKTDIHKSSLENPLIQSDKKIHCFNNLKESKELYVKNLYNLSGEQREFYINL